jgi:hypothetical protein
MLARLAIATLAALALPTAAQAGLTTMQARDVAAAASSPVGVSPARFDLVGLHWRGPGHVSFRTRSPGGRWSAWRPAAPEEEDGPDATSVEGSGGWRLGSPWWTGPSDALQVRTRGRVGAVRAFTVRSLESRLPLRHVSAAGRPSIVLRSAWGADEAIRRGDPSYAPELRFAVVHHTAGTNTYTRAEAPAVVRAIQRYHVEANGWNDIGYNFLVDRFGTVYEGRFGGVDANVVGAHAVGFNTGSVGVALLGTYTSSAPSAAAERALDRLLAWRLDLAHVDPASLLTVSSGGSPKYAAGLPVTLRAVSGHRDVGLTECPGTALYGRLRAIAAAAASLGLPKLFEPAATVEGAAVTFRARLSTSLPWTVVVSDAAGVAVAEGSGSGSAIDWSWDTTTVAPGTYRWTMTAGTGAAAVTPAGGEVQAGAAAALAVLDAEAAPPVVSPDGDGVADVSAISYRLTRAASVEVTAVDAAGLAAPVEPATWRRAGEHTATFDPAALADGVYTVEIHARSADGSEAAAAVTVTVTRTLASPVAAPAVISPNGDGRADTLRLAFTLTRAAAVRVTVTRAGVVVATLHDGQLHAGRHAIRFDGRKPAGTIRDGTFAIVVEADDGTAVARAEIPFASDVTPPRLRLVGRTPPRVAVGEAATLRLVANGATRRVAVTRAATVTIPGVRSLVTLRATAWDRAGNTTALTVKRPGPPAK